MTANDGAARRAVPSRSVRCARCTSAMLEAVLGGGGLGEVAELAAEAAGRAGGDRGAAARRRGHLARRARRPGRAAALRLERCRGPAGAGAARGGGRGADPVGRGGGRRRAAARRTGRPGRRGVPADRGAGRTHRGGGPGRPRRGRADRPRPVLRGAALAPAAEGRGGPAPRRVGSAATCAAARWRCAPSSRRSARATWPRASPASTRACSRTAWTPRAGACTRSCPPPGTRGDAAAAQRVADDLRRHGTVGVSSFYGEPGELGRALGEAELVLDVVRRGEVPVGEDLGSGAYRLLFRVFASHPDEVRSFYEDTVAPLVRYDESYGSRARRDARDVPRAQRRDRRGSQRAVRAPAHDRLPARAREGAQRARPGAQRGPRAARARPEGLPAIPCRRLCRRCSALKRTGSLKLSRPEAFVASANAFPSPGSRAAAARAPSAGARREARRGDRIRSIWGAEVHGAGRRRRAVRHPVDGEADPARAAVGVADQRGGATSGARGRATARPGERCHRGAPPPGRGAARQGGVASRSGTRTAAVAAPPPQRRRRSASATAWRSVREARGAPVRLRRMKKVEAFIRHEAFEPIRNDLLNLGFPSLSISEVKGSGRQKGITERYRGAELTNWLRPKVKLECGSRPATSRPWWRRSSSTRARLDRRRQGVRDAGRGGLPDPHGRVRRGGALRGTPASPRPTAAVSPGRRRPLRRARPRPSSSRARGRARRDA